MFPSWRTEPQGFKHIPEHGSVGTGQVPLTEIRTAGIQTHHNHGSVGVGRVLHMANRTSGIQTHPKHGTVGAGRAPLTAAPPSPGPPGRERPRPLRPQRSLVPGRAGHGAGRGRALQPLGAGHQGAVSAGARGGHRVCPAGGGRGRDGARSHPRCGRWPCPRRAGRK